MAKKNIEEPVRHISESEMAKEASDTYAKLRLEPRVRFTVMPDGSGDKKVRVKINGTVWEYAVGKEQEAPKDVYDLIATKYRAIEAADAFKRSVTEINMGRM